jgi:hypothetical protein
MGDLNFLSEVCQLVLWTDEDLALARANATPLDIHEQAMIALLKGVREITA